MGFVGKRTLDIESPPFPLQDGLSLGVLVTSASAGQDVCKRRLTMRTGVLTLHICEFESQIHHELSVVSAKLLGEPRSHHLVHVLGFLGQVVDLYSQRWRKKLLRGDPAG